MVFRQVNVGTVAVQVVPYNPKRTCLSIMNNGDAKVYVSQDPQKILQEGFPLDPGRYISLIKALGDDPTIEIWAQAETGTQDVRIEEEFGGK